MRSFTDFLKLRRAIYHRLVRLQVLLASCGAHGANLQNPIVSTCIIELDNLVVGGLRAFMVGTLFQGRTATGNRVLVTKSFSSEGEIGAYVLSLLNIVKYNRLGKPPNVVRREEQTIRDPKDVEKILIACSASNLGAFQTALSLNASVFRDLATVRNFYAHRNEDTFTKVRRQARTYGFPLIKHADEFVRHSLPSRPVRVIDDWFAELDLFFDEAVK